MKNEGGRERDKERKRNRGKKGWGSVRELQGSIEKGKKGEEEGRDMQSVGEGKVS